MSEVAPEELNLTLSHLNAADSSVLLETGTSLTFKLLFKRTFQVQVRSWCCEAAVTTYTDGSAPDWWLCRSCDDYLFHAPGFIPECAVAVRDEGELNGWLTAVAELYFDPFIAVLYASQLEEAVVDFFTTLRAPQD